MKAELWHKPAEFFIIWLHAEMIINIQYIDSTLKLSMNQDSIIMNRHRSQIRKLDAGLSSSGCLDPNRATRQIVFH